MEGILETLDSWRSLTHYSPVEGSQVSDHPGGGVLGEGRGSREEDGRREEDRRRERMGREEEEEEGEEEGEDGRGGKKGMGEQNCKE